MFDSYIVTPAKVDQKIHRSGHFLPLTIKLGLNFNLRQDMHLAL